MRSNLCGLSPVPFRGCVRSFSAAVLVSALLASAAGLLTGCGLGVAPTVLDTPLTAVTGAVHGGQQPVSAAYVYLYATTSNGYNQSPTLLGSSYTNASGQFNMTGTGNCPAGQQAYIVANDGNPGLTGAGINNTAIYLVAALGPCAGLASNFSVSINEVSTVAAAYALAGFAPAGGAGMTAGATANTAGFTTSPGNTQGLKDGFLNAANMVSLAGAAYTATPAANSTGVVPQATINSLGDILQDCVNSGGPGSSTSSFCTSLFTAATPPSGTGVAAPVNVFQAALDIARYPGNNVATLYGLISADAAFLPNLGTMGQPGQPNDWTLGISYTSTALVSPTGFAIDANDNVYTVGYPTSPSAAVALLEFSPQGALLSPSAGWNSTATGGSSLKTTDNVRDIKMDPSGNLFLTDGNVTQLVEYTPAGTAAAPTAGTLALLSYSAVDTTKNNYGVAIDAAGDVFTATYKQNTCGTGTSLCAFLEFPAPVKASTATITFGGATQTNPSGARGMAADASGNATKGQIWATNNNGNTVQILKPGTGASSVTLTGTYACAFPYGLALDASSNAWIAAAGNTLPTGATGSTCATTAPSELFQVSAAGTVLQTILNSAASGVAPSLNTPFSVVVDGAGNVFTTNSGASTIAEYSPSVGTFLSNNVGFAPSATYSSSTMSVSGGPIALARSLGVDRSGALWVLSPSVAGNLVQIFGVAAPANPVLASGGYGVQP